MTRSLMMTASHKPQRSGQSPKKVLRAWGNENRARAWYPEAGYDLAKQLLGLTIVREAKHITGYYAIDHEMDLAPSFSLLRQLGKRLYLPRVEGRRLQFYDVTDKPALLLSRWGIPEPTADLPKLVPKDVDLVLCPGLLFDRAGGRLGYGGGYYDRWLSLLKPSARRLGVGFAAQWVEEKLPMEEHDLPMHGFVTEKGAGLWKV